MPVTAKVRKVSTTPRRHPDEEPTTSPSFTPMPWMRNLQALAKHRKHKPRSLLAPWRLSMLGAPSPPALSPFPLVPRSRAHTWPTLLPGRARRAASGARHEELFSPKGGERYPEAACPYRESQAARWIHRSSSRYQPRYTLVAGGVAGATSAKCDTRRGVRFARCGKRINPQTLFRRFAGCSPNRRPTFLRGVDDSLPTLRAQFPFLPLGGRLGSLVRYARFLLGRSPSLPLCFSHPFPGCRAHLPPFAHRRRRGGRLDATPG